jgi:hypothetical protein
MALPEYDPACGLSRFAWILEASKTVRAERIAAASDRRLFSLFDRKAMAKHDAEIDAEDGQRLQRLRRQYDPARNRATK